MWLPIIAETVRCSANRIHRCASYAYSESSVRFLLLQLGAFVVVLTVVVVLNDQRTRGRWDGSNGWRRCNGTLLASSNQRNANDSEQPWQSIRSSLSVISTEKLLSKADAQLQQIFDSVWRYLVDEGFPVSSRGGSKRPKWKPSLPITPSVGIGSDFNTIFSLSKLNLSENWLPVARQKTRQKRRAKPIDVRIRLLTSKRMKSANKIKIQFRSSSPLFWRRIGLAGKARRRHKKKRKKDKKVKGKKEKRMKGKKGKKVKGKKSKRMKGKKDKRMKGKKGKRMKGKATKKGQVDIRIKGKALKRRKKKVSAKKLLKKAIAKQLKRKMSKLSRRAKKALAKTKKSKKARKKLFQSKMVNALRSTVQQAEQVCKSLTRSARRRSSRVKVQCRFSDAERLIGRLKKSRSASNNRKLTKAVSGIMAAVASHMRPLVDVLFRQTLARRRTVVILRRLRSSAAKALRRLVRQAFGLRRALADAIASDRKLSIKSKPLPPSSSSKTMKKLYTSISKMEAGKSNEAMVDTVARVVSVVSQVFLGSVEDLLKVYRLRQITEKKLEVAESSCDKPSSRIDCINAHVFRVLERMVERSSSLVRRVNRILPTDSSAGKRKVPTAIKVDTRILKQTGDKSASQGDAKRASATRVARVILAVARNLRLVVGSLKLAVVRKKMSKSATFKALMKDEGKSLQSLKPLAKPSSAKIPSAKPTKKPPAKPTVSAETVRRVGGTMTLKSLNRVMLSALLSLEKWSRLLYRQTAPSPDEVVPEPIVVEALPSTSARQSAQQVALTLGAITKRLRIVGERAEKTIQQKLVAGKKSTVKPEKSKKAKLQQEKAATGVKKPSQQAAKTSKKDKSQPKGAASKEQSAKSKKEKDSTGKEKKKQKSKSRKKGTLDTSKKKPIKAKKEKQKTKQAKKPEQKVMAPETKKSKKKPQGSDTSKKKPKKAKEENEKTKQAKEPEQKAIAPETEQSKKKPRKEGSDTSKTATTELGMPGHVINRDDMVAELQLQSLVMAETLRGIATKVDDATKAGVEESSQYGIQPETKSEGENLWIRFMNERLRSSGSSTQKKQAML